MKNLLTPQIEAILQKAVAAELYASHLYRHVANQAQRLGLFGAAKFFRAAAEEELAHYQRLADYFNDRGCVAKVAAVPAINEPIANLHDAIDLAYDTEVQLGADYSGWYATCGCVITQQFLLFFLEEQRKAVGEFGDWLSRIELAGDDRAAILAIDRELGDA